MNIHHAYPGGLLKHTAALIKLAVFIADQYNLNKELLVTGALFHDIGKLFEFSVVPSLNITIEGGLVGHIVLGNNILLELASKIKDFPKSTLLQIQHLILSHHGEKEYGSPEVPKTKEAFALHIIDLLDSKMAIFGELQEKSDKKELFSEYAHVLGRRILIDDKS
jgi:3'-5' exoribonuclease